MIATGCRKPDQKHTGGQDTKRPGITAEGLRIRRFRTDRGDCFGCAALMQGPDRLAFAIARTDRQFVFKRCQGTVGTA